MIRAAFGALMALLASCAPAEMPAVSVMSALPLFWGEGGPAEVLQGDDQRAPVIKHLSARHPLLPLDRIDAASLSRAPLLLIAQPRGLSPEELVALDAWLRSGGKALIAVERRLHHCSIRYSRTGKSALMALPETAPMKLSLPATVYRRWALAWGIGKRRERCVWLVRTIGSSNAR
jgi:hypothetical protein